MEPSSSPEKKPEPGFFVKYADAGSPFVIQPDDEECEDVMDTSVVSIVF